MKRLILFSPFVSFLIGINMQKSGAERKKKIAATGITQPQNHHSNLSSLSTAPFGTIYERNSWTNTVDFITQGNSSATLSGGYINISSATTYNWNNTIRITNYQTKLEKWKFRARFRILAWAADSYGIGFGIKSANMNVQNDVLGFLQTTNTGTGMLYIVNSNQTVFATGTVALGVALNDVIDVEADFRDSVFSFTANNITSGSNAGVTYNYASNGSTHAVPNSGYFSLLELGGTHQVQQIGISSTELAGGNIVAIGDSKTIGYFSNTFAGRYAAQLNNNYPVATINAGGADRVTHALSRQDELERLAPAQYLLSIGSNDLRFGSTLADLQTNYSQLVNMLQATGATVFHIIMPEDHTKAWAVNLTPFKDWIASTYGPFYINGVWDSLVNGTILKGIYDTGDGIHLNQVANDKIYEALVASGKLSLAPLPVRFYSFEAQQLNNTRSLLTWTTDTDGQPEEYHVLKSRDGIDFQPVGRVASHVMGKYKYFDEHFREETAYYQLKYAAADQAFIYSPVIKLHNNHKNRESMSLTRVSRQELLLTIHIAKRKQIRYQIFNASAGKIAERSWNAIPGENRIPVSTEKLGTGIFYLTVLNDHKELQVSIPFMQY